jgi:hypothetical protein
MQLDQSVAFQMKDSQGWRLQLAVRAFGSPISARQTSWPAEVRSFVKHCTLRVMTPSLPHGSEHALQEL